MTKMTDTETPQRDGLSRRTVLGGTAFVLGVGATALTATTASAKTPQAQAKYQDSPKGGNQCSKCSLFAPPDACNAVEGKVSPNGWCQLFAPKAG